MEEAPLAPAQETSIHSFGWRQKYLFLSRVLVPNHALRNSIEGWRRRRHIQRAEQLSVKDIAFAISLREDDLAHAKSLAVEITRQLGVLRDDNALLRDRLERQKEAHQAELRAAEMAQGGRRRPARGCAGGVRKAHTAAGGIGAELDVCA